MSLSKQTINYKDDNVEAEIVVSQASVRAGLKRSSMTDAALELKDHQDTPLEHAARWLHHPALVCGTESGFIKWKGKDGYLDATKVTFDQMLDLPEALTMEWLEVVFDLNPQWTLKPKPKPGTEAGKD